MTRKRVCALVLPLALALTSMAIPVSAVDVDDENTQATVTFAPGTSGPGASLYLDNVPALDFGSHTVSASGATYDTTGSSDKLLRVVDNRGTPTGWKVTAEITDSFKGQSTNTPPVRIKDHHFRRYSYIRRLLHCSASRTRPGRQHHPQQLWWPRVGLLSGQRSWKRCLERHPGCS